MLSNKLEEGVTPESLFKNNEQKKGNLLLNLKNNENNNKNMVLFAGKDDFKHVGQLSFEDQLLMRLEKLCIDFFRCILKNHTYEIKLLSQTIDNYFHKFGFLGEDMSPRKNNNESKAVNNERDLKDNVREEVETWKRKVGDKDRDIKHLNGKLENARSKLEQMRHDYLKDISHLREYMFQKDSQTQIVDYIDVRFFEAS